MKRKADKSLGSGQGVDASKLAKAIKRQQTKEKSESRMASSRMIKPKEPSTSSSTSQKSKDAEPSGAPNVPAAGTSSSPEHKADADTPSITRSNSELQMKSIEALAIAEKEANRCLPNLKKILRTSPDDYLTARTRLLVFDYDGTLAALVPNPSEAIAPQEILTALAQLASIRDNSVWIVSGRERKFLEELFPVSSNIGLFAEHGAYHRLPHQSAWYGDRAPADYPWWTAMLSRMQTFVATIPGSHVEVKDLTLVWHYRASQPEGSIVAPAYRFLLEAIAAQSGWTDCKISEGSCIIEARPSAMNKGFAVQFIMAQMERAHGALPEFILCVGDDVTDEGE